MTRNIRTMHEVSVLIFCWVLDNPMKINILRHVSDLSCQMNNGNNVLPNDRLNLKGENSGQLPQQSLPSEVGEHEVWYEARSERHAIEQHEHGLEYEGRWRTAHGAEFGTAESGLYRGNYLAGTIDSISCHITTFTILSYDPDNQKRTRNVQNIYSIFTISKERIILSSFTDNASKIETY